MRGVLVPALVVALSGVLQASEPDLAEHLQRVRESTIAQRPALLRDAAKALQAPTGVPAGHQATCAALLIEAKSATEAKDEDVAAAGWQLAISAVTVAEPLPPSEAAWFLEHVHEAWDSRANDETAHAAIAATTRILYDGATESSGLGRGTDRSLKKALSTRGEPALFLALALGLARAPAERSRSLLSQTLPRKGLSDDDVVSILQALGETGGGSAAPLLLDHVPGTTAAVLEAALIGLHRLDAEALRTHGKKILSVTMKDNEKHYRVMLALSNKSRLSRKEQQKKDLLAERAKAWTTEKIVDTPPMEVPPGIGNRGVTALWWKIIDALDGRIKPPSPPKNARPQFLNGRPNLQGLDWYHWWRSSR